MDLVNHNPFQQVVSNITNATHNVDCHLFVISNDKKDAKDRYDRFSALLIELFIDSSGFPSFA